MTFSYPVSLNQSPSAAAIGRRPTLFSPTQFFACDFFRVRVKDRRHLTILLLLPYLLSLGLSTGAAAEARDESRSSAASMNSRAQSSAYFDLTGFINEALARGVNEISLAKFALSHSEEQATKAYAQFIINEQTDLNQELANIAYKKDLAIDSEAELTQRAKQFSQKFTEKNFDLAYAQQEQKNLRDTIALFQQAADSSDYDIKKISARALIILNKHQKMAEQLVASADESTIP